MRWIFCHSSSHASSITCIFSQEPNPKLMALKKKRTKKRNREKGKEVRRLTPFKLSCNRKLSLCIQLLDLLVLVGFFGGLDRAGQAKLMKRVQCSSASERRRQVLSQPSKLSAAMTPKPSRRKSTLSSCFPGELSSWGRISRKVM